MLLDELELAEKKEKQVLEGSKPTKQNLDLELEDVEKVPSYIED